MVSGPEGQRRIEYIRPGGVVRLGRMEEALYLPPDGAKALRAEVRAAVAEALAERDRQADEAWRARLAADLERQLVRLGARRPVPMPEAMRSVGYGVPKVDPAEVGRAPLHQDECQCIFRPRCAPHERGDSGRASHCGRHRHFETER